MIELPTGIEASELGTDAVMTAGLVELAKRAGLPSAIAGVSAVFVGLGFGLLRFQFHPLAIFHGVPVALMATGVYEFISKTPALMLPAKTEDDDGL